MECAESSSPISQKYRFSKKDRTFVRQQKNVDNTKKC